MYPLNIIDSALSLQIPATVFGANKKVTFSQVVDQMACSLSDSSSLSDLSSCDVDFKHNVSIHVPPGRARKLFRSSRMNSSSGSFPSTSHHHKRVARKSTSLPSYNGSSASEDVFESSLESIESSNVSLSVTRPLSALSPNATAASSKNRLHKISSADSLLSMIKCLTSTNRNAVSTPNSPQLSFDTNQGNNEWQNNYCSSDPTTPDYVSSPGASNRSTPRSLKPNEVEVEVLNPLNPNPENNNKKDGESPKNTGPTIMLEVPNFHYGKCLSPIKELPSPIPTPAASPLPYHRRGSASSKKMSPYGSNLQVDQDEDCSLSSSVSGSGLSSSSGGSLSSNSRTHRLRRLSSEFSAHVSNDSLEEFPMIEQMDGIVITVPSSSVIQRNIRRQSSSSLFEETSFVVSSSSSTTPQTSIPIITTSVYDSTENLSDTKSSTIPPNIVIPSVFISFDHDTCNSASSPECPPTAHHRPPPPPILTIAPPTPTDARKNMFADPPFVIVAPPTPTHKSPPSITIIDQDELKTSKTSSEPLPQIPPPIHEKTKMKNRPPPLSIKNSNFLNFSNVLKNERIDEDPASTPTVDVKPKKQARHKSNANYEKNRTT